MPRAFSVLLCAGLLAINVPADIVWSGAMSQRAYHDLSAIDMNLDGAIDFTFTLEDLLGGEYQKYTITPSGGGMVAEWTDPSYESIALPFGTHISATLDNPGLGRELAWYYSEHGLFLYSTDPIIPDYGGGFANTDGYLGVSFMAQGSTNYGWIQMGNVFDINNPGPESYDLRILGWAYESTPNTAIAAGAIPEPSTGLLSVGGSVALLYLARSRRRRSWR